MFKRIHKECRTLIQRYLQKNPSNKNSKIGKIGIHHHRIACVIGINPDERINKQDIFIDVAVKVDFTAASHSQCVDDTVNYVSIAEVCTQLAWKNHYHLLESYADAVLDELISRFKVKWAWIRIKKPLAIPAAEYATVELERQL